MRLIDVHDNFPPRQPQDECIKIPYAILSHTWDGGEVVFNTLVNPDLNSCQSSWKKIRGGQEAAAKDGLDHIWIDTVCIDKSSSAELGEAINSMYKWYKEAEICYVYLSDLSCPERLTDQDLLLDDGSLNKESWGHKLQQCKW